MRTPAKPKSKDPELARQFLAAQGTNFGVGKYVNRVGAIHGRPCDEYNRIMQTALMLYLQKGRRGAIEHLSSARAWLKDYAGNPAEFPSSGTLLDNLLAQTLIRMKSGDSVFAEAKQTKKYNLRAEWLAQQEKQKETKKKKKQ